MAILTRMRISSDPDELLRRKQEVIDPVAKELAGANGAIGPGGQDRGRPADREPLGERGGMEKVAAEVGRNAHEAGMPEPSDWQQYDLVQHERP